jgi:hypothetical protein
MSTPLIFMNLPQMEKSRWSGSGPKSRALSARRRLWQLGAGPTLACALVSPLTAAPGGEIGTMPLGDYICELPGDATGPAGLRQPGEDFTVVNASSYRAAGVMGSYLLTGDRLTMTGGPHHGKRYERQSDGFVRMLDDRGEPGALRCVRRKPNNR